MNKEKYLNDRKALMNAAEQFISEGKFDEADSKMNEVKDLDNRWEEAKKANANLNALKDNDVAADLGNKSENVLEGNVMETVENNTKPPQQEAYQNAWAKVMMGNKLNDSERTIFNDVNAKFQNAVQSTNEHAVVIPETVTESIWREAQEMFPVLGDLRMTFVPGDLTILKETNSGEDAAWYDEVTEVADGQFSIGELNLTGCELAKAIPVSWKLRKMSIEAFIAYIQTLLAEKVGAALAKGVVSGKGKPGDTDTFKAQPRGVVTALLAETGTPQIITYDPDNATTPDPLTYEKLVKAMSLLKSTYKTGAAVYAKSSTIWNELATLKDGEGRPLFIPDVTSGGVGRIFGLVVKEEDAVDDGDILFGNVTRGYAMNVNENMTIYTEDHVKKRYTDYMSYSIVDGDVMTNKAFALIQLVTA